MAQLDNLIGALSQYSAEALRIAAGEMPSFIIEGAERPVLKQPIDGGQFQALLAEIAPESEKPRIVAGEELRFRYSVGGVTVDVSAGPGPIALLRPVDEQPESTPAPEIEEVGAWTMAGLLRQLVERSGSDLHLSSETVPMLRLDGELVALGENQPLDAATVRKLIYEITPERHRDHFEECGDADFAYEIPGRARFRCNLFVDRKGPGGVFRIIPTDILTAEDLGLSQPIRDLCYLTKGLVLVTGPTGSGKSTTLAAMVDLVNTERRDHIITIEDPIEFVHENRSCLVNQREVGEHTNGFKSALRAALREDPDIVLVGEMRDLETVAIAIETAETGHLVFGTLHTSSAISTVDRLIDQFPADQQSQIRVMLSESLKAVIAQVLCRKIGGGRVAALEVLIVTPGVANLIREGKTFQISSLMQTGRKLGMTQLNDSLLDLVVRKVVEPREAYLKALDKASLVSALQSKGIRLDLSAEVAKAG